MYCLLCINGLNQKNIFRVNLINVEIRKYTKPHSLIKLVRIEIKVFSMLLCFLDSVKLTLNIAAGERLVAIERKVARDKQTDVDTGVN